VTCADFDHPTMVIRIGVDKHGLRVCFGDHLLKISEHLGGVESVSLAGGSAKLRVELDNTDDFDLRATLVLAQESVDVAVDQAHDRDSERRM